MYEVGVVVTYSHAFPWCLARRWGFATWTRSALCYAMDDVASRHVIESSARGVHERSWEEFISECDEYQLLQLREQLPEAYTREIIAYAWGNVGKSHPPLWLAEVARRLIAQRWFAVPLTYSGHICSSLVDDAYLYAGVDLIPGQEDILVTPDDLAHSPLLKPVEVNLDAGLRRIARQSRISHP
jgi:hypothetical protein